MYTIAKKHMNVYYDDLSKLKFGCANSTANNWLLMNQ